MKIILIIMGFFILLVVGMMGYIVGAVVENRYDAENATCPTKSAYNIPQGYINMSQGARLEGVTLYNVTLYAQDDNYTMRSVYGKNYAMIVNGTRIR